MSERPGDDLPVAPQRPLIVLPNADRHRSRVTRPHHDRAIRAERQPLTAVDLSFQRNSSVHRHAQPDAAQAGQVNPERVWIGGHRLRGRGGLRGRARNGSRRLTYRFPPNGVIRTSLLAPEIPGGREDHDGDPASHSAVRKRDGAGAGDGPSSNSATAGDGFGLGNVSRPPAFGSAADDPESAGGVKAACGGAGDGPDTRVSNARSSLSNAASARSRVAREARIAC